MAGVLTSVVGAGGGVLLLAIMGTVLPPLAVVPVHGVVMLGNNVARISQLYKLIDWRFVGVVIAGSAVGSLTAGSILVHLPEQALQV
ncbi:MAG: TSUP family transporter, partial [Pseudomonadota bacterium]